MVFPPRNPLDEFLSVTPISRAILSDKLLLVFFLNTNLNGISIGQWAQGTLHTGKREVGRLLVSHTLSHRDCLPLKGAELSLSPLSPPLFSPLKGTHRGLSWTLVVVCSRSGDLSKERKDSHLSHRSLLRPPSSP